MGRLDNLEDTYNELVAIGFDFATLPATSKYSKYYKWKTDPTVRQLGDGVMPSQGKKISLLLKPFGLEHSDDNNVAVQVSGRAHTKISGNAAVYGALDTIYGLKAIDADAVRASGFKPAKVIMAVLKTTPTAVLGSANKITGRAYKKRTDASYTCPFGRVAATSTEFERESAILAQLEVTHSVTFTPERRVRKVG
jgi:hypothetical protein